MDVLPSGNIFHELQVVHDTGYYDGKVSPEEHWQQVGLVFFENLLAGITTRKRYIDNCIDIV